MSRQLACHRRVRLGAIEGHAIYPMSVFLKRLGIGRTSLTALRAVGLPVHTTARKCFIDGAEAIVFFRSLWAREKEKDKDSPSDALQQKEILDQSQKT